ncbi:MAG: zinc-ribbon domain-containing protein [Lachnospiraceae bacterium]|nr:zinc-ribbon domain-containing protein [Lachnospiraceae bacterium]
MFCLNCGKVIPDGAKFCAACGTPIQAEGVNAPEAIKISEPVMPAEPVIPAAPVAPEAPAATYAAPENYAAPASYAAPESYAVPESYAAPVQEAPAPAAPVQPAPVAPSWSPIPEEPQQSKKGGKGLGIVIAAVAAIVVLIGGIAFMARDKVSHAIHKTFDKPKDYYAYVEKKNLTALTNGTGAEAVTKVLDQIKSENVSISETMKIRLGSRGKDFTALAKSAGVDLSWLDSVGISYTGTVKDTQMKLVFAPILNDVTIANAIMMLDIKEGQAFASIPELSEKFVGISFGDAYSYEQMAEQMEQVYGMFEEMAKACPDAKEVEKLALKYYQIVIDQVEEMQKDKAKLEAGDVTQDCTQLTMELKSKDVQKIVSAVIKELKKDKDVKKMLEQFCDSMKDYDESIDSEEAYNQFIEGLEEVEAHVEEIEIEKLVIEAYVDGDGKIIGRAITIKNNGETVSMKYGVARKGDKVGVEISVKTPDEDSDVSIVGNGTEKSNKFNGDFKLKVAGQNVLAVDVEDYDLKAAEKGEFAGSFTFKAGSDVNLKQLIQQAMSGSEDSPVYALVANLEPQIRISGNMTMDSHKLALTILDAGSEIISLEFEGSTGKGEDVSMPSSYIAISADGEYDEEELKDFVKSLNYKAILDNLRKANLPEEWVSMAEQYIEQAMDEIDLY